MKVKGDDYDVGVIIGRFQVPELHTAHRNLIQYVVDNHDKVIIFLGLSPLMATRENPLDFESRKQMILSVFPKVNVLYIKDVNSDDVWSKRLDEMVNDLLTPSQTAVLYGSRDSFIKHYTGKHATRELESDVYISGTEVRKNIAKSSAINSHDYRAGWVGAAFSKFPTVYTTVDVIIWNDDETKILLGKKPNEPKWRLIGGFADPASSTFEDDARREVMEEAGVEIIDLRYMFSINIDDWRYRKEVDQIRTMLFEAVIKEDQVPVAGDDIAMVKWFNIDDIDLERDIMEVHWPLLAAYIDN